MSRYEVEITGTNGKYKGYINSETPTNALSQAIAYFESPGSEYGEIIDISVNKLPSKKTVLNLNSREMDNQ